MEIEVKLFAGLRMPHLKHEKIRLEVTITVQELLTKIKVPSSKVAMVLVNGRHARHDQQLEDGDTIALFPAIAGG